LDTCEGGLLPGAEEVLTRGDEGAAAATNTSAMKAAQLREPCQELAMPAVRKKLGRHLLLGCKLMMLQARYPTLRCLCNSALPADASSNWVDYIRTRCRKGLEKLRFGSALFVTTSLLLVKSRCQCASTAISAAVDDVRF
jgi:hypothetical protein